VSDVTVFPRPWLWKPRTKPVRLIEIHSTRGGSGSLLTDYNATINWMQSGSNGSAAQGWGSSCSKVLGPNGELAVVLHDNQMPTYSAGYGGAGSTYAIDEYGISYEWAQPDAATPFPEAMYQRGAKEIARDCVRYSIPPVFVSIPRQTGVPPAGLVRHDRCENGAKLGKSDPGPLFDERKFLGYLKQEIMALGAGEDDVALTDEQAKRLMKVIEALDARIDTIYRILTDDYDAGGPGKEPRWIYWQTLMQQAAAAPTSTGGPSPAAILDELKKRL
jgi:hypothetical protein